MLYGDNDLPSRDNAGNLKPLAADQFDISGYTFGGYMDTILLDSFDPGESAWQTQDNDNPFGRETLFGSDYLHGPTWAMEAFTNGYDINEALDAVGALGPLWWAEELKAISGAFQILRYRIGSQTRRVYGRGRKFWHGIDPRSYAGTAPVSLTFKLMSNMYFDDEARMLDMPIIPSVAGGFSFPITAPFTTIGDGAVRAGSIEDAGGSIPAPFHLYIHGPVSRPYVIGNDWKIQLNADLDANTEVHISTYSGMLVVEDNFGNSYAGKLSPTTRLNSARLKPGPNSLTFGGVDTTGTAWARVVWRPAYSTL